MRARLWLHPTSRCEAPGCLRGKPGASLVPHATGCAHVRGMDELVNCPQCGLPSETLDRDWLRSTDGPIEHVKIVCVQGHGFFMPAEMLS